MEENKSQIIIYQTENGETKLDVRFQDETVWLTQKLMSELFQTSIPNINMHLKNIFEEGELEENRTIKDFLIVQREGNRKVKRKQVFYNLDAIISVGYRIKSNVATKFRQWATSQLREYIVKEVRKHNNIYIKIGESVINSRVLAFMLNRMFSASNSSTFHILTVDHHSKVTP